jgi:hypothetical protein
VKDKAAAAKSTVQDKVSDTFGKDDDSTPQHATPTGPAVS